LQFVEKRIENIDNMCRPVYSFVSCIYCTSTERVRHLKWKSL